MLCDQCCCISTLLLNYSMLTGLIKPSGHKASCTSVLWIDASECWSNPLVGLVFLTTCKRCSEAGCMQTSRLLIKFTSVWNRPRQHAVKKHNGLMPSCSFHNNSTLSKGNPELQPGTRPRSSVNLCSHIGGAQVGACVWVCTACVEESSLE